MRNVYIVRFYTDLTRTGKPKGYLIECVLYDASTGEEILKKRRAHGLRNHAKKQGWNLVNAP